MVILYVSYRLSWHIIAPKLFFTFSKGAAVPAKVIVPAGSGVTGTAREPKTKHRHEPFSVGCRSCFIQLE
jgi:hypothetical protein